MITKNNRMFFIVKDRTANIIPLVLMITISITSISIAQEQKPLKTPNTIELISTKDCVCSQFQPNTNLNGDPLTIGVADDYYFVSLVGFDISSLPDCAIINSASLSLYCSNNFNVETARTMELADDWNETTVTFNNMPYGNADGPTYYTNIPGSAGEEWITITVTQSVRDWYNNIRPNYGFQIAPDPFTNGEFAQFHPRESGTNLAPKLIIKAMF